MSLLHTRDHVLTRTLPIAAARLTSDSAAMLNAGRQSRAPGPPAGSRAGTPPPPSACCPERCTSSTRTAPSPQAMASASSRTVPGGALAPSATSCVRSSLMRSLASLVGGLEPGTRRRRQPADAIVHLAGGPGEVDAGLALVDLGGVGDAVGRLRRSSRAAPARGRRARAPSARRPSRPGCRAARPPSCPRRSARAPCGRRGPYRGPPPCA